MDVLSRTPPQADHRIQYGAGEFHFGDLWLPLQVAPGHKVPLVVFFHGGWWKAQYDLAYAGFLCSALKREGIAVWSVEYRRVGNQGGGWPGTFQDAATGFEFISTLAKTYPLDLSRVVVSGHSAGGHLAFWMAGRHHVPANSEVAHPHVGNIVKAAVALAGAVDLRLTIDLSGYFTFAHDKAEVEQLMGGSPANVPDRYRAGNPGDLLPLNATQYVLQGTEDEQIPPELPGRWAANARHQGDTVNISILQGADHFDVVDPESKAWPAVLETFRKACFG